MRFRPTTSRTWKGLRAVGGACASILLAGVALPTSEALAQLTYDRTTFVHGTASDSLIWRSAYGTLSGRTPLAYLSTTVKLKDVRTPTLDKLQSYQGQLGQLSSAITGAPGQHVLVGHSLGGIEARGAYLFTGARPQIAGIITIAATHRGTYLSDNREQVKRFFADVQRRVDDGAKSARFVGMGLDILVATVTTAVFHWNPRLIGPLFASIGTLVAFWPADTDLGLDQLYQLTSLPAVVDQATTSSVIQSLQGDLADAAIPRANIYGQIPPRNAAIRVRASMAGDDFRSTVRKRNRGVTIFKACKVAGYSIIIGSRSARRCSFAAKVLGRVDERWMGFVNGRDANGRPRNIPFDGVVANENSQYPSPNALDYQESVSGVNHQNIYSTTAGLNAVSRGMLAIRMQDAPPPPPAPEPLRASISGPTWIAAGNYGEWHASPTGGTAPYTYQWSGLAAGSASWVGLGLQNSGTLHVDIWDSGGQHAAAGLYVTVDEGGGSGGCLPTTPPTPCVLQGEGNGGSGAKPPVDRRGRSAPSERALRSPTPVGGARSRL